MSSTGPQGGISTTVIGGTELNQTYRIDSLIGIGGMGEVFRGHNIQTGDPVAIKIVLPEFARDEMILDLFRKEARILNHLAHDAIVRYFVFSIDPTLGRPYLAMEFVDGPSLAERIKSGPLSLADVVFLQRRLADGLQKAHEAGIIHRDMSPDNIILPGGRMDRAKIIDFGIAKSANVGGATLLGGSFAGKYNFVSPEQLGLFGGEVTAKSDVYSLGLVLAGALLGHAINMSGTQVEVIEKRRVVPDLSAIDGQFRSLLEAMLQPDPAARLQSMSAVRDWQPGAAGNAAAREATVVKSHGYAPPIQKPVSTIPPGIPKRPPPAKPARTGAQNAALFFILAVVVIAGGAFAGWYYVQTQSLYPVDTNIGQEAKKPEAPEPPQVEATAKPRPAEPAPTVEKPVPQPEPETAPEPEQQASAQILDKAAGMVAFVENYKGGDCFYAAPQTVTNTSSAVAGFGKSQEPFDVFMQAFEKETGIEPDIRLGIVSEQQCSTVNALRQLSAARAGRPTLVLNKDVLVSGTPLEGKVSGLGGRKLELVIIDFEGNAQSLRKFVAKAGDDFTFRIKLQKQDSSKSDEFLPMIILAFASGKPLESLTSMEVEPAAELLPRLLAEIATRDDAATAVGYFKLVAPGG